MSTRQTRTRAAGTRDQRRDDRPYVLVLFGLLVVIGAMALGPLRSLAAANDRVDQLTEQRDVLAEEVDELEQERADLNDPAELEVYAREHLGLVRPGEVPYVVLPDDSAGQGSAVDQEAGSDRQAEQAGAASSPWYRRLADAVASLFG